MNDWLTALAQCRARSERCALVCVAGARGSTPREVGARMLVTSETSVGSIGGGNLEFKAIEIAREMLSDGDDSGASLRRFPLGPSLGQCCGGVAFLLIEAVDPADADWVEGVMSLGRRGEGAVLVSPCTARAGGDKLLVTADGYRGTLGDARSDDYAVARARTLMHSKAELDNSDEAAEHGGALFFEPLHPNDFRIELFGAGHVGRALVQVLKALPCTIRWIDSRKEQFPRDLPDNVEAVRVDDPEYEVDEAPPNSFFLIMTHNHALDQAICERILRRGDARYCGLIGSVSKRRKFEKRMLARGVSGEALARLVCPIGVDGISGKHPVEIAVAVAAELLQTRERAGPATRSVAHTTGK